MASARRAVCGWPRAGAVAAFGRSGPNAADFEAEGAFDAPPDALVGGPVGAGGSAGQAAQEGGGGRDAEGGGADEDAEVQGQMGVGAQQQAA